MYDPFNNSENPFRNVALPSDGAILAAGLPLGLIMGLIAGLIAAAAIWAVGLLLIAAGWIAWRLVISPVRFAISCTWYAYKMARKERPGHQKAFFMAAWKRTPALVWEVCFAKDLRKVWHFMVECWRRVQRGAKKVASPFIAFARLVGIMKPPRMVYIQGLGHVPARY